MYKAIVNGRSFSIQIEGDKKTIDGKIFIADIVGLGKGRLHILKDDKYKYLFTVDEVNKLVMQGIPFRDAYKIVGQKVEDGSFTPPPLTEFGRGLHEGAIGNLCNEQIRNQMQNIVDSFAFESVYAAISNLLK